MSSQPVPEEFRRACAQWATGIAIVTAQDDAGVPHGMTVNSFTSVSLDPALILICVDVRATILEHLVAGRSIAINVLAEDQAELSSRFARKVDDRFENLDWAPGRYGSPVLGGTIALFECSVNRSVAGGDHQIIIAQVNAVSWREGRPLLYFESGYQALN